MRRRERIRTLLLLAPLYFATMVLVHELGHATIAATLVPGDVRIYIWPGYEILPDWGRTFPESWPDKTIAMTYVRPQPPDMQWKFTAGVPPYAVGEGDGVEKLGYAINLSKVMGSVSTLLVSLTALALILLLKPRGLALWLLAAGALLHLDILTGTVFPLAFDARHFYFWGSETPEALDALTQLGISRAGTTAAIVALSLLQFGGLYYVLRVRGRPAESGTAQPEALTATGHTPR